MTQSGPIVHRPFTPISALCFGVVPGAFWRQSMREVGADCDRTIGR
jgi:hypothetical protein